MPAPRRRSWFAVLVFLFAAFCFFYRRMIERPLARRWRLFPTAANAGGASASSPAVSQELPPLEHAVPLVPKIGRPTRASDGEEPSPIEVPPPSR